MSTATADTVVLQSEADQFAETFNAVRKAVGEVIVGQGRVIESSLTAIFCGGNVLLEGVPGLGKTELVKAMSRVLELDFRRIQFTPDLMPADIIGTNVLTSDEAGHTRLEFRRGPIFTQLLLADEINRASPKTQSALLETMQEHSVTTGGMHFQLQEPFFVLATQNPIEQEGTYPLPEAQLDRFMFKVVVPFVTRDELNEVVTRTILKRPFQVQKITSGDDIMRLRTLLDKVVVVDPIRDFAVRLVLSTHPGTDFASENIRKYVRWGASPRAAQSLIRAARVRALASGRPHVSFADIRHFACEVLQHRVLLNYDGQAENIKTPDLIAECVDKLPESAT
jgi:MoxR-like ATPase